MWQQTQKAEARQRKRELEREERSWARSSDTSEGVSENEEGTHWRPRRTAAGPILPCDACIDLVPFHGERSAIQVPTEGRRWTFSSCTGLRLVGSPTTGDWRGSIPSPVGYVIWRSTGGTSTGGGCYAIRGRSLSKTAGNAVLRNPSYRSATRSTASSARLRRFGR